MLITYPRSSIPLVAFSATQGIISALFSQGQQGLLLVPEPTVDGVQVLYKLSDFTDPVTAGGDPTGGGKEVSGNDNHLTQSVSADRPTYNTDGSLHWITGDGVSNYMDVPINIPQPVTISIAFKVTGSVKYLHSTTDGTGANRMDLVVVDDANPDYRMFAGNTVAANSSYVPGEKVVITSTFNGASSSIRKNGVEVASGNAGTNSLDGFRIMASFQNGDFAPADIYGCVVREGVLTQGEIDKVENYLADRAGVTL